MAETATSLWRSPLHGVGAPSLVTSSATAIAVHGNAVAELPGLSVIVLRGRTDDAAFVAAVERVVGVSPATPPRRATPCRAGMLLWSSPDEWMLVCRRTAAAALLAEFDEALRGVHAQCVDQGSGHALLRLVGPDHLTLLRHLTPYDVESMAVGTCANTIVAKATITLVRSDPAGMQLICRRSYAEHVWNLLQRAGRPYALQVATAASVADVHFVPLLD